MTVTKLLIGQNSSLVLFLFVIFLFLVLVLRSLFPISKFDFGKAFTEFVVVDAWIQFYVSTQSCSTSLHSAKQQSEGNVIIEQLLFH